MPDLMKIPNIQDMLKARNRAIEIVDQIRDLRENFDKLIHNSMVRFSPMMEIERQYYRHEHAKKQIDSRFWDAIVKQSKLTNSMTEKAKLEFECKIQENPPEFTVEELIGFSQNATTIYGNNIENTIKEVYRQLIGCHYSGGDWRVRKKSNLKRIEKSFRISGNISWNSFGFGGFIFEGRTRYSGFNFEDLLTACRLLDGQGRSNYSNSFDSLCQEQFKEGNIITTDYFTVKCYLNGNQLVKFTNLNILESLNRVGANGELPDVLKKKYKPEHC